MVNGVNTRPSIAVMQLLLYKQHLRNGQYRYVNAAWQMNTTQTLAENRLHKMADDEHQHQQNMTSIRQERAEMKVMKNELAELMGGIEL